MSSEFMWGSPGTDANWKPGDYQRGGAQVWTPNVGTAMNLETDIKNLQNAPSYADAQMQRGLGAAIQQAQAAANSQRGVAPALAARIGAQQGGQMGLQAAQIGAALRAQEMAQRQEQIARYRGLQLQQDEQGRLMSALYNQLALQQAIANKKAPTAGFAESALDFGANLGANMATAGMYGMLTNKKPGNPGSDPNWDSWGDKGFTPWG